MASTGKKVAGVFIAATIAITLFNPISAVVGSSTGVQTVSNSTFTAQYEYQNLPGYDVKSGSLTVYWYNSSAGAYEPVGESTYNFRPDTAAIEIENGTRIAEGDDMKASYEYQATSGTTTTVVTMVPLFVALLILGTLGNELQKRT